MLRRVKIFLFIAAGFVMAFGVAGKLAFVHAQGNGQGQVANKSDQLISGYYDVVKGWPKPLSTWPGHTEEWTWGSTQGIFAQNPNRIIVLQRGELKALPPTAPFMATLFEDSQVIEVDGVKGKVRLSAPVKGQAKRNASVDPLGSPGEPDVPFKGIEGKDYRTENLVYILDRDGKLVESWTQWDKLFKRPHKVRISPYDPEKRIWIDDDGRDAIFILSNDGKKLLQTIGTPNERAQDEKHFGRQTDIAWLPDGTFFVSDGYTNTRVVKFDKNGKYLMAWGEKGNGVDEKRPNYFNTVHGIAVDNQRRVYVVDRANRRIQIFDENGKFLEQWYMGDINATYDIMITADQHLWMSDGHANYRIYKYDLTGRLLYYFGGWGLEPGQFWGVHQMSVDQEGNLYTAEVFAGRAQKFRPKKGANPEFLISQPLRVAWKD